MAWLHSLDLALFRFVNATLSCPLLDRVMPFFSGNGIFIPAVIVLAAALLWKGGVRGRLFVALLLLVFALGDIFVINTIKQTIARPRPFVTLDDVHMLSGVGGSGSLPSSHASTWFAATTVAYFFYRRSLWFMLPIASLVGLSRLYVGVHYPSDVLTGAILGAGYACAGVWGLNHLWQRLGPAWFPLWHARLPSLVLTVNPRGTTMASPAATTEATAALDQHWLRFGYLFIFFLLAARLIYIASGRIELSEDEAYQWTWSKHLALSYYSKPPLIAYTQFLGTSLWGDNAFGVRFFSPVIAAVMSFMLLRFMAREVNARAGFWLVLILTATPLPAVGATLMTIDPLSVLFWTAAMLAGWRAAQPDGTTRQWLWVGLWTALGFLSKYIALAQLVCWMVFFFLWRPARVHLRRPGPWLALLVTLLGTLPVLIWNSQHGWITVRHVGENAKLDQPWEPTLKFFWDFLFSQTAILNPFFFVGALWAAFVFWRRRRGDARYLFLLSMGAPVYLGYWLYSLHSRIQPNWIAPAIVPLFCLMVIYWQDRWREGVRAVKGWLIAGISFGLTAVVLLHDTNLIHKATKHALPMERDPLHRVRAWSEIARVAGAAREQLTAAGRPAFIITGHYGLVGEITFYLPAARAVVKDRPLVYFRSAARPQNQYYFWPGYREQRRGEDAIFIQELDRPTLNFQQTLQAFLTGEVDPTPPPGEAPPDELLKEFRSVTNLGVTPIAYRGQAFRWVQLFVCRELQ